MLIIHGENTSKSRDKLAIILQEARAKNIETTRLPAKELSLALLEETFAATSLFGTDKIIVIEELHSLPKSGKKDQLIEMTSAQVSHFEQDIAGLPTLILWEKRQLTATMLKKFGNAQAEEFKLSSVMFKWLDGFGSKKDTSLQLKELHEVYNQDGAEFLFIMLGRQVRMLLSAKDDGQLKGAPFMIAKLKKQASAFSVEKLQQIHTKLVDIDVQQKTSNTRMTLQQQLDLLVMSL
jgi:DNA polymerase III delta subunit